MWLACGDTRIQLYAKDRIVLGKLRAAPVDYCLRSYPVEANRERCQRVSRQHAAIAIDATTRRCVVTDLGSANGTAVAGRMLNPQQPFALEDGLETQIAVPDALTLAVRPIVQRTRQAQAPSGPRGALAGGLDGWGLHDAVVIRRPDNRPGLLAALVQRRVLIGPPEADLPVAGWAGPAIEIAIHGGRWIWRQGDGSWCGLRAATTAGPLACRLGDMEAFV